MNYTQLTEKKKVEIDILLKQGMSMRKVASVLGISHSTISRYKAGIYKKRKIDITVFPKEMADNFLKVKSFIENNDNYSSFNPFKIAWSFVKVTALSIFLTLRSFGFFSEKQCIRFSENIKQMKEEGIIKEEHIRYLIKKEDGKDLLI